MSDPSTFDGTKHLHSKPDASESISLFVSLACISLMSLLFGRKTAATRLSTINYARGLVVALYLCSWLFSLMAAMLVQTNNDNQLSCTLSIFTCIVLYALSKIIIYLFLVERVHVVTSIGVTRLHSRMYRFNLALVAPYGIVLVLAVLYRVAKITPTGECQIGLEKPAAIPFIAYDVAISTWLTGLFVNALKSSTSMLQGPTKSKLRDVARRTLIGSLFALVFSTANIAAIVYYEGDMRGLACLAMCTLDVTLNAIVIHWVTSRGGRTTPAGLAANSMEQQRSSRIPHGFGLTSAEKRVSPLESHISVTVEDYVEQYHELHYSSQATSVERY